MAVTRRADSPFWWYDFAVNGRRFRGSTGKAGKRDAQIVEEARKAETRAASPVDGRWRVRTLAGHYWDENGQHQKARKTTFYQLEAISDGLGPNTFVADINGGMLNRYRAKRRGAGLGPASINRELEIIRAMFGYAERVHGQRTPRIAWGDLRAPEPPGRTRWLSRAEYAALIDVADDELRAVVLFAVSTGLRRENVLSLDWKQIDLDAGRARFVTKGGQAHVVKLSAPVVAALARVTNRREGRVFARPNFRRRWDRAVADAGLDDFRFHDLRHTFASWARMGGADIAAIKDALGHSDISMTMRYAHITPDDARTAFDVVGETFSTVRVFDERNVG